MGNWITPKTTWAATNPDGSKQFFNLGDYNRIRGNIEYLHDLGVLIYPMPPIALLPNQDYTSIPVAGLLNALENNLAIIRNNTYGPIVTPKTWIPNNKGPTFEDWNRLESLCLAIYNIIYWEYVYIPQLELTLGGGDFE